MNLPLAASLLRWLTSALRSSVFCSGHVQGVAEITIKEKTVSETSTLIAYDGKINREELARVVTPAATATHQPIPHHQIVEALVESLSFRRIGVIQEEYLEPTLGREPSVKHRFNSAFFRPRTRRRCIALAF